MKRYRIRPYSLAWYVKQLKPYGMWYIGLALVAVILLAGYGMLWGILA